MKKKCLKRKKGDASVIGTTFTIFILLFIFMVMFKLSSTHTEESKRKEEFQMLGRQYIITMETTGYLDNSMKSQLINDLKELGATSVSLSGTTMNQVGYGEKITLAVSADFEVDIMTSKDGKVGEHKEIVRSSDSWTSTAKN